MPDPTRDGFDWPELRPSPGRPPADDEAEAAWFAAVAQAGEHGRGGSRASAPGRQAQGRTEGPEEVRASNREPAQPRAGARGRHDRGSAAHPRGGRLGQDARPGPSHRIPDGRQGRAALDLAARRQAYYGRVPVGPGRQGDEDDEAPTVDAPARPAGPPRPVVPGERRYRDGDRVRHERFGQGVVVTSKLTRDDEEVTVAFEGQGVKRLLATLANLELVG